MAKADRSAETSTPRRSGVRAVVRTCKACHEAYKPPGCNGALTRRARARVACVSPLCALSLGVAAQNVFDFDDWMQRIV